MKICIIGAGLTGLAAAHELSKRGHQVTIFEADKRIGGLASGIKDPQWTWAVEKYYHHWFESDQEIQKLLQELNLSRNIQFHRPVSVMYTTKGFFPLDSPMSLLKFPGLNIIQKLRFGVVTAYLKYLARWQSLESQTAHHWLQSAYGKKAYQKTWEPMLAGKFASYYKQVSMAWMWARLKTRTPKLGTYSGGFQRCVDDIAASLKNRVTIHTNTPILSIHQQDNQVSVVSLDQASHLFDACIITASPKITQKIVPQLPQKYRESMNQLKSLAAVVVTYSLKHPLSPQKYYWYNLPKSEGYPCLALVEHTNFVSRKFYNNETIVYCGDYRPTTDPIFTQPDAEIVKIMSSALKKINPHFTHDWITKAWVNKTPYAQPIPFINHSDHIPPIKTPLDRIYSANMSHIYPFDRGTNYAVKLGRHVARMMHNNLNE